MDIEKLVPNEKSAIKNTIAVMSGKGGVGKSFVSSLLAVSLKKHGNSVGVLDADITGPSIPKMFGVDVNIQIPSSNSDNKFLPVNSSTGIKLMSLNILTKKKDTPVIWRGPLIANTVGQFYTDVVWGNLDYLVVDLPPGTGDVPLTVMQSINLSGLIVVTSPQDLVNLIVKKSVNMADKMNVPILGIVENMSYLMCPECNKKIQIFGKSKVEESAKKEGLELTSKIPLIPKYAECCDSGKVESIDDLLSSFTQEIIKKTT